MSNVTYSDLPWIKKYQPGVEPKVSYENISLHGYLERSAAKFPDRDAMIFQGYRMSFRDFKEKVDVFSAALDDMGIKPGDAVAILLPNMIPCVIAYYATLKLGAIAVMNNPLYSDRELEHQFNDSRSTVLVTLDLLADRMVKLREKTGIRQIIYTTLGDYLPFFKQLLFPLVAKKRGLSKDVTPAEDLYQWKSVLKQFAGRNGPSPELSFDAVAQYQYTGGTTGVSKGVMLTHSNLSKQVQQIRAWFPMFQRGKEIILGALPFFHVFGLSTSMNLAVYMGWTNVLVPKPQPEPLLEAIAKFRPTFAPLVPTMYIGMLNHPDIKTTDMSSIKGCFSGSASMPVEVIRDFEKATGGVIVEGYGLTESTPVTHVNPFSPTERKVGSIGLPIGDTEARIMDLITGDSEVPMGEQGELVIRGPQVMKGYWNKPEETADTLRDGWLYTGDIAKMDEDGFFYIVDRKKDMIISGGYNIYPRDIEEVLYEHPKVKEATAIGIPHDTRGETVMAFIVPKDGETLTEEEVLDFCKDRLAKYKWPTRFEFRDELPKTNVGKILKKDLRAEYGEPPA